MSKLILNETAVAPSTPATGKAAITVTENKTLRLTDDTGASKEFEPSIFGQNFAQANKSDVETNGTTSESVYLQLPHNEISGGVYRVGFTVAWSLDDVKRNINISLYDDNVLLGSLVMEPTDSGADIRNWNSGFFYYTATTTGSSTIEMRYAPDDEDDTATIFYAGLETWRVE